MKKKRLLSLVLTICMVIGLLSAFPITGYASEDMSDDSINDTVIEETAEGTDAVDEVSDEDASENSARIPETESDDVGSSSELDDAGSSTELDDTGAATESEITDSETEPDAGDGEVGEETPTEPDAHGTSAIYFGDVNITTENASDVLGDGTVSYDFDTNTLTLNNLIYLFEGAEYTIDEGLVSTVIYSEQSLNICLIGDNIIENLSENYDAYIYAVLCTGDTLTFSGDGTLAIYSLNCDIKVKQLEVSGGTINVTSIIVESILQTGGELNVDVINNGYSPVTYDTIPTNSVEVSGGVLNGEYVVLTDLTVNGGEVNILHAELNGDCNITEGTVNAVIYKPKTETDDEYDYDIIIYGANSVQQGRYFSVASSDTITFDDNAMIDLAGTLSLPSDVNLDEVFPHLEGNGIITITDEEGNIVASYNTEGELLIVSEEDMDFTGDNIPTGEGYLYDPTTKTLTLDDGFVSTGYITLPDGVNISVSGVVRLYGGTEAAAGTEESVTISGDGTLVVPYFYLNPIYNQTLYISKGTTLESGEIYVYAIDVAGNLIAVGMESQAIMLDGGQLIRRGSGETGGRIYAESEHRPAVIIITNDGELTDEQLISKYVVLNGGTEKNGATAGIVTDAYVSNAISFFGEGKDYPEYIVEIIPPDEVTPPPTTGGGGGGGGGALLYNVIYHPGYQGPANISENYRYNAEVEVKDGTVFAAPEGMTFAGWADTENGEAVYQGGETFKMPATKVDLYALWTQEATSKPDLNREDHIAYIMGYPDGSVGPERNVTREETAMIFYRLLDADTRNTYLTSNHPFADVEEGCWSETAIATLYNAGIIFGRTADMFVPEAPITRAEYAAIAARFGSDLYTGEEDMFDDIAGHWANEDINRAASYGWIEGDGNRMFRPDDFITRAEAVTLINRVLERNPKFVENLLDEMLTFTDNLDTSAWYYIDIQEAANAHEYQRKEDGTEKWTSLSD